MSKPKQVTAINTDPVDAAKSAGLRYVTDKDPGLQRKRWGAHFRYTTPDGKPVRDAATLGRIKSLVIPPAWKDVWICANPKGHLQATGRDVRGRKQSRYHPHWRQVRDENKYERMMVFGAALPLIREHVEQDLSLPGMPRPKVLATVVRLMETTLIRVGNEEYAQQNHSYGLTTMRNKHVQVAGSTISFKFQGKSGVRHAIDLSDRRLAKIIRRCQDIPGHELFQYVDADGNHHSIDSADVNDYMREISHQDFTAKDFRTWAGTVLACTMLRESEAFQSQTEAKRLIVKAIKDVAARLGNTPSVCRKCYVHPAVLDCFLAGTMMQSVKKQVESEDTPTTALRHEEITLLKLLQQRLGEAAA